MGGGSLGLGSRIATEPWTGPSEAARSLPEWELPAGTYRAKDIVREAGTILEAVCVRLGDAAIAEPLLDNLQASLAISGREAVLPFASLALGDETKSEFVLQAQTIGASLARWAREFCAERTGWKRYGEKALGRLVLRSRCDQHLWTPETVSVLMGPAGSPEAMQLFNEYLHQLILLRDALIPFENWEEVPIPLGEKRQAAGLRYIESARDRFFTGLIVRKIPHREIVLFAQSLLCPELSPVGYGFQYGFGTVLPAAIGDAPASASKSLLRWHPAQLIPARENGAPAAFAFDYAYDDYEAAPRSWIDSEKPQARTANGSARFRSEADLEPAAMDSSRVALSLRLSDGRGEYRIDLGQALRGHRYMYRPEHGRDDAARLSEPARSGWIVHSAADLLGLPGLVASCEGGVHYVAAEGNPIVLWALLGKLLPQNVIVIDGDAEAAALRSGKRFGAKFLLDRMGPWQDVGR